MEEWKEYKLEEVCSRLRSGKGIKSDCISNIGLFPVIGGNGMRGYTNKSNFKGECAVIGRQGANCGNVRFFMGEAYMTEHAVVAVGNELADSYFLARLLSLMHLGNLSAQSAQPGLSIQTLSKQIIRLPSIRYQREISTVLKSLDDKIELNRRINDNLEQQAQALFKSWFVDFEPFKDRKFVDSELGMIPEGWRVCSAETIFKINIGKTPPRKEQQWFTNINHGNVKWVSISDLGSNEIFIEDSKEYLTKEAIAKFNIIVVPEDTILVSFKLTVGRVGISNCELTTNEAVARFYLPESYFREYTYLSLKNYNYARLGSTSSIATAVNSKIIKNMKLLIPPVTIISEFSKRINPLFNAIRIYENEIRNLSKIRNTLLPKLMSGELKINDINN